MFSIWVSLFVFLVFGVLTWLFSFTCARFLALVVSLCLAVLGCASLFVLVLSSSSVCLFALFVVCLLDSFRFRVLVCFF